MFDNQPCIVGTQPVRRDSAHEGGKFVCRCIGRISEDELIGAFPPVWPIEKVLNLVGANRHVLCNSAIHDISSQQGQRLGIGFDAGHVRRASTQCFNADGACSCIKIKKLAIRQPIPDD
jgi:hypothetical protein